MRVFVTGATGFIGSAVVKELLEADHQVVGLARSDAAARALITAGAQPHRGSLNDLDSLRSAGAAADGVIHLAYFHKISQMSVSTRLGVMLGGSPRGIVARFAAAGVGADGRAIHTLGTALAGPDRALVVAFPTLALSPGRLATEDDAADPSSPGAPRIPSEEATLAMAATGVRASMVRLAPAVHGEDDAEGLIPRMIALARKKGSSAYVGDGSNRWPAVHKLDAARLFRLALENGEPGARYHAVAEEGVPVREIAEVIGRRLNVRVAGMSPKEANGHFSWMAPFVAADNPVSSDRTRELLGWQPTHATVIPDIDGPSYFGPAAAPAQASGAPVASRS
jgi:nucleoside-diphosphate-sugar epimerase